MSNDRLRERSEKSSLGHMASLGKAALTVGVGAALLYRGGGKRFLSEGVDASRRFLGESSRYLGSGKVKEVGVQRAYKEIISDSNSIMSRAISGAKSSSADIRYDDPRSIGSIMGTVFRLQGKDGKKILGRMYDTDHIRLPAAKRAIEAYAKDNPVLAKNIDRFTRDSMSHLDDYLKLNEIASKHRVNPVMSKDISDLMKALKESSSEGRQTFIEKHVAGQKGGHIERMIDELIDPEGLKRVFGSSLEPKTGQKIANMALGDQPVTVGDMISNPSKYAEKLTPRSAASQSEIESVDAIDMLKKVAKRLQDKSQESRDLFESLYFDPNTLRKSGDEIYSFKGASTALDDIMEYGSKTLVGNILKFRDIHHTSIAPKFLQIASGSVDPQLATLANREKGMDFLTQNHHFRILDKVYEASEDGLRHVSELDNTKLISGRYGVQPRLLKQMVGDIDYKEPIDRFSEIADIGTSGSRNFLDWAKGISRKKADPLWRDNVVRSLTEDSDLIHSILVNARRTSEQNGQMSQEAIELATRTISQAKKLSEYYSKNLHPLSTDSVTKLANNQSLGEKAKAMFNILELDDEGMMNKLLREDGHLMKEISSGEYQNKNLMSALYKYIKDPLSAKNMISIKSDKADFFGGTHTSRFHDIVRTEVAKEGFMRHATESSDILSSTTNYGSLSELIETSGLKGKAAIEAKRLADWAAFQKSGNVFAMSTRDVTNPNEAVDMAIGIVDNFTSTSPNAGFFGGLKENLKNIVSSKRSGILPESPYESFIDNTQNLVRGNEYSEWIHIQKPVSALDILKDLNDTTKLKSFGKQFIAGRNDPQNITTATLLPYWLTSRIPDALGGIGLDLSSKYSGSTFDYIKGMTLTRGLPIAIGATYLSYMSDMTGAVTGTSLKGAAASGLANADLAIRKVTDITGLTGWIENEKKINPLLGYHTGKDFDSYEERKEWYEKGVSPMRKARWWNFGSANEWRGSEISYFQPNYLRRIDSQWKDAALYDNVWEKWSRSWLPTPTAPLSPLRYLMDPYWLEDKHSEDRPYMMTGKMFSEETPWGAVLNPTLGSIVKPQSRMHQDRLDRNFVDVRTLIEERNMDQIRKAKNKESRNLIKFKDGIIEPVSYTTLDAPTPGSKVARFNISGGNVTTSSSGEFQEFTGVMEAREYIDEYSSMASQGLRAGTGTGMIGGFGGGSLPQNIEGLSYTDKVGIRAQSGDIIPDMMSQMINRTSTMQNIEYINRGILARGRAVSGRPKEPGIITPESIHRPNARYGSNILQNREAMSDLKGLQSGDDMIGELLYTSKYMAGIYGYGLSRLFPGQPINKVADAGEMTSITRSFWDANTGGLGETQGEIIRRFIPAQNKMIKRFNPLMNNMPDWMPERFRTGDPYCVSKDTLIEVGKLDFIKAGNINIGEEITTHKGNYKRVDNLSIRKIKKKENVHSLKVTSLTATEMKFSEEHPILIVKNPTQRRNYKEKIESKIHRQANAMIKEMKKGIFEKKSIAKAAGITTDDSYRVFKIMQEENIIYDYNKNKTKIIPKNLKEYDIEMIESGMEWKKVKDIKEGDYVAYPTPYFENKEIVIDLKDYLEYPYTEEYIYISGTLKKESTMHLAYEWMDKNGVPNFKHGERKKFLLENGFKDKDYENAQSFKRKGVSPERIKRFLKISKEIAFFFGLYIAEGSCSDSYIHMAHNINEKHLFEEATIGAEQIHERINSSFKRRKGTNGADSHIFSKPISQLIKNIFGVGAHSKSLPNFFADMDKDILKHFLRGYFSGDGNSLNDSNKNKKSKNSVYRVSLTSVNLKLLLQIRKLLIKYEIIANIQDKGISKNAHINGKKINSGKAYCLNVRGVQGVKLGKLLQYSDMEYCGERSATHTFFLDKYICLRVIKNTLVKDVDEVWGFEVGEDDSFCISGVATHNTKLPKGEMRLPGRGYESLNPLHSDEYGEYGAYDRMRILADIAPYSHEYKVWRDIAQKTIDDPMLKDEMKETKERVIEQSRKYDFHHYNFLGRGTKRRMAIVDQVIDNNHFTTVGDQNTYRMAGISVSAGEDGEPILGQKMFGGMRVMLETDEDQYKGVNDDEFSSINAAVFIDGQNLNRQLVKDKMAQIRENDMSAAAHIAHFSDLKILRGKILESIAHAPIPYFQQKFFKIRDPLESYKHEQVYGISYSSWTSPIDSFLKPAAERSLMSSKEMFVGNIALAANYAIHEMDLGRKSKFMGNAALMATNRGAFIGGFLGMAMKAEGGSLAYRGAQIGALAQIGAYAITRSDNLIEAPLKFATVGSIIGNFAIKDGGALKGGLAGAAIGLATSASQGGIFNEGGLAPTWIPERTKEKWDTQEYFDRLNYIKYSGLFEKASRKARLLEGTDIKKLVNEYESEKEEKERVMKDLLDYKSIAEQFYAPGDSRGDSISEEIGSKIKSLEGSEMLLTTGKWGRDALIYKQARDSTAFGLKEYSSWAQLLRSTPRNERDHFLEFSKENDPKKRKEILKYISPYQKRSLQIAWGEEVDKPESMESFFSDHKLPAPTWSGWRPNIDMSDVQVKTIENEGMLLSDFGFYESQLRDKDVINAPQARKDERQTPIGMRANLITNLRGLGLTGVNVSIDQTKTSGIQVIADIARITQYNIREQFRGML